MVSEILERSYSTDVSSSIIFSNAFGLIRFVMQWKQAKKD